MRIKITSDSTCDLSKELIAKYDIKILPMPITMGTDSYLDGVDATALDVFKYFETTGDLAKSSATPVPTYQDFFKKYSERIVFGTDVSFTASDPKYSMEHYSKLNKEIYDAFTTEREVSIYTAKCKGLNLPSDVLDKLFYENFMKAHSPEPKPINKVALKKYIHKYSHLIKDERIKNEILKYEQSL